MGLFEPDKYRTKDKEKREIDAVTVVAEGADEKALGRGAERGRIIGESINFTARSRKRARRLYDADHHGGSREAGCERVRPQRRYSRSKTDGEAGHGIAAGRGARF